MRRTFSIGHSCRTVCSSKAFESPAIGTTNRDCPTSAPGASATTQADPAMSAQEGQRGHAADIDRGSSLTPNGTSPVRFCCVASYAGTWLAKELSSFDAAGRLRSC